MSWGWFDICVCAGSTPTPPDESGPAPIPAPFELGDAEYVDHVEEMLSRLVYQLARIS